MEDPTTPPRTSITATTGAAAERSSAVLLRIQQETERVKRRLSGDHGIRITNSSELDHIATNLHKKHSSAPPSPHRIVGNYEESQEYYRIHRHVTGESIRDNPNRHPVENSAHTSPTLTSSSENSEAQESTAPQKLAAPRDVELVVSPGGGTSIQQHNQIPLHQQEKLILPSDPNQNSLVLAEADGAKGNNIPYSSEYYLEASTGSFFDDPVPPSQMSHHLKGEHETFKQKLIDDVLGESSSDKVPMEKVVMLIWQFRDDPQVVKFMTRFVAKYSKSKSVFDGIEFYLPQLAHMIIHLEAEWDDAILERFALVIAQQSLHFALQLNWILQGAIEDYQPELPDGTMNPSYHPLFYSRCLKLLSNMERCVVYRRPRSLELQRLYEKGKITKAEYQIMEHADRRFNAVQITGSTGDMEGENFGGTLLYKRHVRTACYKPKPWKKRYFATEGRMLNCYNSKGGRLVRSMPLEGALIKLESNSKYPHTFSVANRNFEFRMRAASQEDQEKWIMTLQEESTATTVFGHMDTSLHKTSEMQQQIVEDMTPAQRARYEFFRNERDFVRRLTDLAEELRFKEPAERKVLAPKLLQNLKIPPCVYLPLCNSTDVWKRASAAFYNDTRVFNTNERCPVIMYFLANRGEPADGIGGNLSARRDVNLDVAEYMHSAFEIFDEAPPSSIEEVDERDHEGDEDDAQMPQTPMNGNGSDADPSQESVWSDQLQRERQREDAKTKEMFGAENGKSEPKPPGSTVWHESFKDSNDSANGNRNVQRLLRDSWVSIPRKLAARLEKTPTKSRLDTATGLQSVPILEGGELAAGGSMDDSISVSSVSRGRSSILSKNRIVLGDMEEGDIDIEYINRATQLVSNGESWAEKSFRMLTEATKGQEDDVEHEVVCVMSKSNDDLRQEVFVMQMIHYYKSVFAQAKLPLWLKTYRILSTSSSTGLIEVLTDATSIHGLKSADGYPEERGLRGYFEQTYGGPDSKSFKAAQQNFMHSLAGYSIVSYLLGLKDRHNGNIMIDTRGHLIFIDFGFAMGMAPGHEFSMERAPFKFTKEYLEVMGGPDSECFREFKRLFVEGFKEARKNSQIALGLVEIMMYKSNYPCFSGYRYGHGVSLRRFEERLMLDVPDHLVERRALSLISNANQHSGTYLYDAFQKWSNGYEM